MEARRQEFNVAYNVYALGLVTWLVEENCNAGRWARSELVTTEATSPGRAVEQVREGILGGVGVS